MQSISKALADAIEERRGVLTIQEVTVAALVAWLEAPTLAERVSALERQQQPTMPALTPAPDMLSFD